MSCTVKVEFQGEIRRFVLPKDINMESFDAKIRELFPALEDNRFSAYYRDQDGDVVRIGSTEELHHACQCAGPVLRLAIQVQSPNPQVQSPHSGHTRTPFSSLGERQHPLVDWSPSQFFADPFSFFNNDPFSGSDFGLSFPWEHRQLKLKHREEQLKNQREYERKVKEMCKQRQQQREQFIQDEAERFREEMDKRMSEEGGVVKRSKSGTVIVAQPQVKSFGSWEPVSRSGPGWSSTSWGPVGYQLHYYYPGEEQGGEQSKKEDDKGETKEEMETK